MFGLFTSAKTKSQDAALNAELDALHRRMKVELSDDCRQRLYAQLLELREAGIADAARMGLNGKEASRMMKGAAIQTIYSFFEIERMFGLQKGRAA